MSKFIASMGPRLISRGNKVNGVPMNFVGVLQWGRD